MTTRDSLFAGYPDELALKKRKIFWWAVALGLPLRRDCLPWIVIECRPDARD